MKIFVVIVLITIITLMLASFYFKDTVDHYCDYLPLSKPNCSKAK